MDFVIDKNPKVIFYADSKGIVPEFVKEASTIVEEDLRELNAVAFADPVSREFPVHTKAACWLSYVYATGTPGAITDSRKDKVLSTIKVASVNWGISEDIEKVDALFSAKKEASSVEEILYAVTLTKEDGTEGKYLPLTSAYEVQKAASQITKYKQHSLIFGKAANAVCKKAKEFGIEDVIPYQVKEAGVERLVDLERAMEVAENRSIVLKDPEVASLYTDIVKTASIDTENSIESYIELFETMDKTHGVQYGKGVTSPYAAFYSGAPVESFKQACDSSICIGEVVMPSSELDKLEDDVIDKNFKKASSDLIKSAKEALKDKDTNLGVISEGLTELLSLSERRTLFKLLV